MDLCKTGWYTFEYVIYYVIYVIYVIYIMAHNIIFNMLKFNVFTDQMI